jgi:hypothetical protein
MALEAMSSKMLHKFCEIGRNQFLGAFLESASKNESNQYKVVRPWGG